MKTCNDIQQQQMAGHTKLTAVTIWSRGCRCTRFLLLHHDNQGRAQLPVSTMDSMLPALSRGETFSVE